MGVSRSTCQPPAELSASGRNSAQISTRTASDAETASVREVYLAQLMFAARTLADSRFAAAERRPNPSSGYLVECLNCRAAQNHPDRLDHSRACPVGRVLRLLEALKETSGVAVSNPTERHGGTVPR